MTSQARQTASRALDSLPEARRILLAEARGLEELAARLDLRFQQAVHAIDGCRGCVLVTGMGKAGLVGQKVAATLASLGVTSHFLHPAEAVHGDLGRLRLEDLVLAFSYSGETEELTRLLPIFHKLNVSVLAVTRSAESTLGRAAASVIELGRMSEACNLGLAPTVTTTAMLAIGDALALTVSHRRGFRAEDFAMFHPGGSLGRQLALAEEVMRPLSECRLAGETETVREALIRQHRPGRRTGAMMVVNAEGELSGVFTDSDLARLLSDQREATLLEPLSAVMTADPVSVRLGTRISEVLERLERYRISELPVLDAGGRPVGIIDVTDIVGQPLTPPRQPTCLASEASTAAAVDPPAQRPAEGPAEGPPRVRPDGPCILPFSLNPPRGGHVDED